MNSEQYNKMKIQNKKRIEIINIHSLLGAMIFTLIFVINECVSGFLKELLFLIFYI